MYIVSRAYDDNTADILDIGSYQTKWFSEIELIRFAANHDVMGLSVSGGKVNYINAYSVVQFPTEDEATEYCRENGIGFNNKMYLLDYWFVFEKSNRKIHVAYFIRTAKEVEWVYLGRDIKYTPYQQAAQEFTKKDAQKKVAMMNNNPKAVQHWMAERVVMY